MLHPVLLSPRIQNLDCKHSKGMTGLVLSVLAMTYWLDPVAVATIQLSMFSICSFCILSLILMIGSG